MTFAAPWALWGLLLLAGPVLVHLLSRRAAKRTPFPSLQLLRAERLPPVSRRRLDDRGLLLLRLAAVLAAVLAMARPVPPTGTGAGGTGADVPRVLVIDTSARMARAGTGGVSPGDEADRLADSLTRTTARVLRVLTAEPAAVLPAAAAWLARHGGGELVVLTGAPRGVLSPAEVAALPAQVGVRLVAIPVAGAAAGRMDTAVRVRVDAGERGATVRDAMVAAVRRAAPAFTRWQEGDVDPPHLIVRSADANDPTGATVVPDATVLRVITRVQRDDWLAERLRRGSEGTRDADSAPPRLLPPEWLPVTAAQGDDDVSPAWLSPTRPLVLRLRAALDAPASLAVLAATIDALHAVEVVPLRAQDEAQLDDATIAALARPSDPTAADPTAAGRRVVADDEASAPTVRWLWVLVLLLLVVEQWWRARLGRAVRPDAT
jgi:hypothetical protein